MSARVVPPAPAHPALAGLVERYRGYDVVLDPSAVHLGLPSPSASLLIEFEAPLDVAWLDRPGRSRLHSSISGLHTSPALVRTHGRQFGVHVDLGPAGVRGLLGVPLGELTRQCASLADFLPGAGHLHERLAGMTTWAERYRALDAFFLAALARERRAMRPEIARAIARLGNGAAPPTVTALAAEVGYSRRRLLTLFRAELGVGLKTYARLIRFQRARDLAGGGATLARAAQVAGYADQAHLSREWRGFAARSPRETLRAAFLLPQDVPILQDEGPRPA